jgi:hypothetical protein
MILLSLWIATSLGFGAFWALTGSVLSLSNGQDTSAAVEVAELQLEEQPA